MGRRRRRWLIERDGTDTFAVLRNGRRLCSGRSERDARKYVEERRVAGDRVDIEDPDGYRIPVR